MAFTKLRSVCKHNTGKDFEDSDYESWGIVNALIHRDYLEFGSEVHIDMFDDRIEIYSPGGMPDGRRVQDLDLRNVSSRRRNPIIADIFNRLKYMDRRGSGFKKILDSYEFQEHYTEEMGASSQRGEEYIQHMEEVLLDTLRKNPCISRKELAEILMISEDGVKYHLKKLKNKGLIEHLGASRGGYWRVK